MEDINKVAEYIYKNKLYPQGWDKQKLDENRIAEMVKLCCRKLASFSYIPKAQWSFWMNDMYFVTKTVKAPSFFGAGPLRLCFMSGQLKDIKITVLNQMGSECEVLEKPFSVRVETWRYGGSDKPTPSVLAIKKLEAEGVKIVDSKPDENDALPWRFLKHTKKKDYKTGEVKIIKEYSNAWWTDPMARLLRCAEVRHLRRYFPDVLFGSVAESSDEGVISESIPQTPEDWASKNAGVPPTEETQQQDREEPPQVEIEPERVKEAVDRQQKKTEPPPTGDLPPWPEDHPADPVDSYLENV